MLKFELQGADRLLRDLERFPDVLERHLKRAAEYTADRIADEARRRLKMQLGPEATGATLDNIEVQENRQGNPGYTVVANRPRSQHVPRFLEHGTEHMRARPFLDVAAQLEEGPHNRRMREAIDDAIAEVGLGS